MEFTDFQIKVLAFFVTSFFFLIEALLHYNMGKNGKFAISVPDKKSICKILLIIFFFSFLSSCTMHFLELLLKKN